MNITKETLDGFNVVQRNDPTPLHPKARALLRSLNSSKPGDYGVLVPKSKYHLDVRVSSSSAARAAKIMSKLLHTFEKHRWKFKIGRRAHRYARYPSMKVTVSGEEIGFYLKEQMKRVQHVLTTKEEAEKQKRGYFWAPKWDYHSTGILYLQLEDCYDAPKQSWKDGKKHRLEEYLAGFCDGLESASRAIKQARSERIKQERLWQAERERQVELKRIQDLEVLRRQNLLNDSKRWHEARQLREYVAAVETMSENCPTNQGVSNWVHWALDFADEIDPLASNVKSNQSKQD